MKNLTKEFKSILTPCDILEGERLSCFKAMYGDCEDKNIYEINSCIKTVIGGSYKGVRYPNYQIISELPNYRVSSPFWPGDCIDTTSVNIKAVKLDNRHVYIIEMNGIDFIDEYSKINNLPNCTISSEKWINYIGFILFSTMFLYVSFILSFISETSLSPFLFLFVLFIMQNFIKGCFYTQEVGKSVRGIYHEDNLLSSHYDGYRYRRLGRINGVLVCGDKLRHGKEYYCRAMPSGCILLNVYINENPLRRELKTFKTISKVYAIFTLFTLFLYIISCCYDDFIFLTAEPYSILMTFIFPLFFITVNGYIFGFTLHLIKSKRFLKDIN